MKIISLILHFENITIELIGSWVWVYADTKEIKEKLKEIELYHKIFTDCSRT